LASLIGMHDVYAEVSDKRQYIGLRTVGG